jgi:hypothetical protein
VSPIRNIYIIEYVIIFENPVDPLIWIVLTFSKHQSVNRPNFVQGTPNAKLCKKEYLQKN